MYFLVESKRATATKDSWLVVPSISQCCAKHTSRFMGIWHTSLAPWSKNAAVRLWSQTW